MRIESVNSVTRLYRAWRCQARLFAYDWEEPYLYAAHSYYARSVIQKIYDAQMQSSAKTRNTYTNDSRREKRLLLCKKHIRQLADANLGWPHAVERALDRAYGRRGNIRHDLLNMVVPPHPSPAVGEEAQYASRQRLPYLTPSLRALLLSSAAQRTTPAKRSTLECPPKLRIAKDSAARIPGKSVDRRRVANAHWRYVTKQIQKLRMPLGVEVGVNQSHMKMVRSIEQKARTKGTTVPHRVERMQNTAENLVEDHMRSYMQQNGDDPRASSTIPNSGSLGPSSLDRNIQDPIYLRSARHAARFYGSRSANPRQVPSQRPHGFKSTPKDYAKKPRARRRQWARLLARTPILSLQTENHAVETDNDPEELSSRTTKLHAPAMRSSRPGQKPWQPARDALQLACALTQEQNCNGNPFKISLRLSNDAATGGQSPRSARSAISQQDAEWLLRDRPST